jgi:hypothetical protein
MSLVISAKFLKRVTSKPRQKKRDALLYS